MLKNDTRKKNRCHAEKKPHDVHMDIAQQFINDVKSYMQKTNMSARAFGVAATNDSKLLPRIFSRRITLTTIERVEKFMRDNPPPA